jgi:hypothetical protein
MALVVNIIEGERAGEHLRFDALSVSVGRADQCSIQLPDRGISRHHCELSIHNGELWIQDQGTTNGTQLNGETIHRSRVANGSEIAVGPVRFRVLLEGAGDMNYKELADYRGLFNATGADVVSSVPIPHPSLRGGNRWVEPGVDPKLRMLRVVAAAMVILFLGLFAAAQLGLVSEPEDGLNNTYPVLKLVPNQTFKGMIGYSERSRPEVSSLKGVILSFDHAPGFAVLTMDVASIDTGRELELVLNGKSLLFAPKSKQWLIGGVSILLPEASLLAKGNQLELRHRQDKETSPSWGVRQIRLRHFPAPAADLQTARQHFDMAKARFRSRRVHPHNLPAAARLFRDAALLTYSLEPRPGMFLEARQRFAVAHQELTGEFRRSFLDAQRASQLEGRAAACRALDTAVRRFTDRDDWRYQRATEARRKVCSEGLR